MSNTALPITVVEFGLPNRGGCTWGVSQFTKREEGEGYSQNTGTLSQTGETGQQGLTDIFKNIARLTDGIRIREVAPSSASGSAATAIVKQFIKKKSSPDAEGPETSFLGKGNRVLVVAETKVKKVNSKTLAERLKWARELGKALAQLDKKHHPASVKLVLKSYGDGAVGQDDKTRCIKLEVGSNQAFAGLNGEILPVITGEGACHVGVNSRDSGQCCDDPPGSLIEPGSQMATLLDNYDKLFTIPIKSKK